MTLSLNKSIPILSDIPLLWISCIYLCSALQLQLFIVFLVSAQGFDGMKYSLISRDWIADCVEIMHEAYAAVSDTLTVNICANNGGHNL